MKRVLRLLKCTAEPVEVEARFCLDKRKGGPYSIPELRDCYKHLARGGRPRISRTINWIQSRHAAAGDLVRRLDLDTKIVAVYEKRRLYTEVCDRGSRVVFSTETGVQEPSAFTPDIARAKYRLSMALLPDWVLDVTFVVTMPAREETETLLAAFDRLFKSQDVWSDCDYVEFETEYSGDMAELDDRKITHLLHHVRSHLPTTVV